MKTKISISAICVLIAVAHLIWPKLQIDMATLVLLVVAILPWLAGVIRSLELPGGFKIELQDIKAATEKVTTSRTTTASPVPVREDNLDFLRDDARGNPNLALVGLRIEIERRLSRLAEQADLPARRSAGVLLRDLVAHEQIDGRTAAGLSDLIALGNQAAHGVKVSSNAASWALDKGSLILEYLDSLITTITTEQLAKRQDSRLAEVWVYAPFPLESLSTGPHQALRKRVLTNLLAGVKYCYFVESEEGITRIANLLRLMADESEEGIEVFSRLKAQTKVVVLTPVDFLTYYTLHRKSSGDIEVYQSVVTPDRNDVMIRLPGARASQIYSLISTRMATMEESSVEGMTVLRTHVNG